MSRTCSLMAPKTWTFLNVGVHGPWTESWTVRTGTYHLDMDSNSNKVCSCTWMSNGTFLLFSVQCMVRFVSCTLIWSLERLRHSYLEIQYYYTQPPFFLHQRRPLRWYVPFSANVFPSSRTAAAVPILITNTKFHPLLSTRELKHYINNLQNRKTD